jgi:hypothetical protein
MNWDGEHIDGMSNDDAILLTGLRLQPASSDELRSTGDSHLEIRQAALDEQSGAVNPAG